MPDKAVIALGGNAIIRAGQQGTIAEQFANTRQSMGGIVELVGQGYNLAITHGNGPQVGNLLIQQMAGIDRNVSPLPLGVLNAATEGTMGYMIEQSLHNMLHKAGIERNVVTILTEVLVDENDPSIKRPSKPVGPFYDKEQADKLAREFGWTMVEDSGRGWRQVVPSPRPKDISQKTLIRELVDKGHIVIACGGGGIPYYHNPDGTYEGFDAVIDKDWATALLARQIDAQRLVILTGVDKVALDFNKPSQRYVDHLSVEEAQKYFDDGQFPKGSMGPKIQASIWFLENGGGEVIITSIEKVCDAFAGKTGTKITR